MPHDTRTALIIWGNKSTDAEYLAHGILAIEKFENIDPIHPQGGPDGTKDVLCEKEKITHVAACYFPNNSHKIEFRDLKKKFVGDLKGVKKNGAKAFIFLTNVEVPEGHRKILAAAAEKAGCIVCLVYHLERLRAILDSPAGYGLRQKYLGIKMTSAEKISAKAANEDRLIQEIAKSAKKIAEEKSHFDSLVEKALRQGAKLKKAKRVKRKGTRKKL